MNNNENQKAPAEYVQFGLFYKFCFEKGGGGRVNYGWIYYQVQFLSANILVVMTAILQKLLETNIIRAIGNTIFEEALYLYLCP